MGDGPLSAPKSSALLLFPFLVHEQDNEADSENDAQGQEDGHRRTSKGKGWKAAGLYASGLHPESNNAKHAL